MKIVIDISEDFYADCKEWVADYCANIEQAIIAEGTPLPQGEWIFIKANEEQTDGYECSVCKATYHTKVPYFSEFNFCPNCGAKMKGGAE